MIKRFAPIFLILFACFSAWAQVPMDTQIQIVKAEDARRYDAVLENLLKSPNPDVRKRAALAAGRIGKQEAIPALVRLLEKDANVDVRTMAAFALGETESINGADAIFKTLADATTPSSVTARAVEAAGKIAAANPKNEKSKRLGVAILKTLEFENTKRSAPDTLAVRLALTAALRARPDGAAEVVHPFLAYSDPNIVADALNTLARLRAKNANRDAPDLLATNLNAVVRANAARVLGAAEDKDAVDVLIKAATNDSDLRVRVSAIRSLATLKDARAVNPLIGRFRKLLGDYSPTKRKIKQPSEKNEILELEVSLGRLLSNSNDKNVIALLDAVRKSDKYSSPETEVAYARISPETFIQSKPEDQYWLFPVPNSDAWPATAFGSYAQGIAELSIREPGDDLRKKAIGQLSKFISLATNPNLGVNYPPIGEVKISKTYITSQLPEVLRAYARFKPDDLESILREQLASSDVFVRATAAELMAENFPTPGIRISIETAFKKALTTDKQYDDAQLAMLDAMAMINKASALDTIYLALDAPDYLVRKKALDLLDDPDLLSKNPNVASVLTLAREKHSDQVLRYDPKTGTKLGQVLNTDADYRRALSRKNGTVKAIVNTEKGTFTIDLLPEDAPLTVDNFIKLARSNYFNGLEVHRVVPNFVMQDGDPRGDGNGGPSWSIRCEINMVPYERGAVGMALSGKDTGGSQWFVTHSPQPHLDGGYTVFGRVNETGMKVVDNIVRGDKIVSIRIVGK
jgi:cyclophilin family peptidyl-prolyl cis-trans isomerase/HEAT repeat protein